MQHTAGILGILGNIICGNPKISNCVLNREAPLTLRKLGSDPQHSNAGLLMRMEGTGRGYPTLYRYFDPFARSVSLHIYPRAKMARCRHPA